eukprot:356218-Chlamydomonas_euryale.AAC.5
MHNPRHATRRHLHTSTDVARACTTPRTPHVNVSTPPHMLPMHVACARAQPRLPTPPQLSHASWLPMTPHRNTLCVHTSTPPHVYRPSLPQLTPLAHAHTPHAHTSTPLPRLPAAVDAAHVGGHKDAVGELLGIVHTLVHTILPHTARVFENCLAAMRNVLHDKLQSNGKGGGGLGLEAGVWVVT